jgi:hypothetical protein
VSQHTRRITIYLALIMSAIVATAPAVATEIQEVAAKTLAKDKFKFPADLSADKLNVLFLGIADEQEVGQQQGDQLLVWHAELEAQGAFADGVVAYHFPVMAGVPFFVKGIISGAMRDVYEGKVPFEQVAVLHIKDTDEFSASLGVPNDQLPTIALVSADGEVVQLFHGGPDSLDVVSVNTAIKDYLAAN